MRAGHQDIQDFKSNNIPRDPQPGWRGPSAYPLGHKIFERDAVNAHDLIQRAADSGVALSLTGDALKVRGQRGAVEELSPQLRIHKAAIVELLTSAARMSAANDPAALGLKTQPRAAPPVPGKLAKQTFMERQDTWRELDQASQLHHINCPTCIAAGKGYGLRCETGFVLWEAYSDASSK